MECDVPRCRQSAQFLVSGVEDSGTWVCCGRHVGLGVSVAARRLGEDRATVWIWTAAAGTPEHVRFAGHGPDAARGGATGGGE